MLFLKKQRKVIITVEGIEGECPVYREGDRITLEDFYIVPSKSDKICLHALSSMSTFLIPFSREVSAETLGLGKEEEIAYIQCPDPGPPCTGGGTVLFRLERKT